MGHGKVHLKVEGDCHLPQLVVGDWVCACGASGAKMRMGGGVESSHRVWLGSHSKTGGQKQKRVLLSEKDGGNVRTRNA